MISILKKSALLLLAGSAFFVGCAERMADDAAISSMPVNNTQASRPAGELPGVTFAQEEVDLGRIPQGKPVTHTFTFSNSGKSNLVIQSVEPSCGCTAADFSRDPLAPGESGFVKAVFNAAEVGVFNKSITFRSNASPATRILVLKGEVVE